MIATTERADTEKPYHNRSEPDAAGHDNDVGGSNVCYFYTILHGGNSLCINELYFDANFSILFPSF
jgi:hypothetical protein